MNQGYVYILTNLSMPSVVKIGRTAREVEVRASELWQAGVPTPFDVYAKVATFDCVQLEAFMHGALHKQRVTKSREFFAITPERALQVLNKWLVIQVEQWVAATCGHQVSVTSADARVHRYEVERLANELDQTTWIVAEAIEMLTGEELRPALDRAHAKRVAEERQLLGEFGLLDDEADDE